MQGKLWQLNGYYHSAMESNHNNFPSARARNGVYFTTLQFSKVVLFGMVDLYVILCYVGQCPFKTPII